jgi:hypothetical protein
VVAGDDAGAFELAHAAQAWRGRQVHALGKLGVRQARLALQVREYCAVNPVHE